MTTRWLTAIRFRYKLCALIREPVHKTPAPALPERLKVASNAFVIKPLPVNLIRPIDNARGICQCKPYS